MPAMALWAASVPASSVKPARVVEAATAALTPPFSTMEVMKDMMADDRRFWTPGMAKEAMAMRPWRIVTSPPTMMPGSRGLR